MDLHTDGTDFIPFTSDAGGKEGPFFGMTLTKVLGDFLV